MSSHGGPRQPKIPTGSYLPEDAVNPLGTVGAPSLPSAQPGTQPCEDGTDLMERVVERGNMLRALRRVEQNKGAAGVDGMGVKELRPYLDSAEKSILPTTSRQPILDNLIMV